MTDQLLNERDLDFLLFDVLKADSLCERKAFSDHNRESLTAALQTAAGIAREYLLPHNRLLDEDEPQFDGKTVSIRPEVKQAMTAIADAGFLAGRESQEEGGIALPETVMLACMAYFMAANPSTSGYPFLTMAAARLLKNFGSDSLKEHFLPHMQSGRFSGTMALTEPQAGSSLADITTKATPADDGTYRIKGHKIYISGGDHELTDNIVHMVLAKIEGAPPGVKGISLFVVPKFLLQEDGSLGERNDVALAGLFHKLGYRGTTSTALNFGEKGCCVGYLIGEPHQGLKYMFQMMNEARLGVGLGAASIGYRGYMLSLDYAKGRPQGRPAASRDPLAAPVNIIEHADVRRMLLAQKAYCEGALALTLYGGRLVDDISSAPQAEAEEAQTLLDLLTPIMKAWPSEYGVKANDLAIQVYGGAGYTREYPVEQCWRDNRLNPIHEGTNGIQALDLLGRKVWQEKGRGLTILHKRIQNTLSSAPPELEVEVKKLDALIKQVAAATASIGAAMQQAGPDVALSNAASYLHLVGHTTVAWLWLMQAAEAQHLLKTTDASNEEAVSFYSGKLQACRFFYRHELPLVQRDVDLLMSGDTTTMDMQANWF
ncbi:acyl-CoA dehydrogenase [Allohahella sp. A8]|uniref:acyl-CoA dehydrogenase n=1 Tax=Allohahella sp. A8 TaxID=3141461 RepID=UPI003A805605